MYGDKFDMSDEELIHLGDPAQESGDAWSAGFGQGQQMGKSFIDHLTQAKDFKAKSSEHLPPDYNPVAMSGTPQDSDNPGMMESAMGGASSPKLSMGDMEGGASMLGEMAGG